MAWTVHYRFRVSVSPATDERELPRVHGLFIYEREGKEAFLRISAEASVRPNPSSTFANQVTSSFDDSGGLREREQTALSLIGFSKMAREPLAQAILCISAVELLSTDTRAICAPGQAERAADVSTELLAMKQRKLPMLFATVCSRASANRSDER